MLTIAMQQRAPEVWLTQPFRGSHNPSELRKPIRSKGRISSGTLNVSMTEIMPQRASTLPIVSELVVRRMSEHMGMNLEWQLCGLTRSLDHSQEPGSCNGCSGFGDEDVWAVAL